MSRWQFFHACRTEWNVRFAWSNFPPCSCKKNVVNGSWNNTATVQYSACKNNTLKLNWKRNSHVKYVISEICKGINITNTSSICITQWQHVQLESFHYEVTSPTTATQPSLHSGKTTSYCLSRLQTKYGKQAFSYCGLAAWNKLPHNICASLLWKSLNENWKHTVLM